MFDCWHPGEVLLDPAVGLIVAVDETNPEHQLHLKRLKEEDDVASD